MCNPEGCTEGVVAGGPATGLFRADGWPRASKIRPAHCAAVAFDVEIPGVATAVPAYQVSQADISERAKVVFPHLARLEGLYANTGIETRYACEPPEWYYERHGWEARTASFQRHALALLE